MTHDISRREFVGIVAGAGATILSARGAGDAAGQGAIVPKRPFGRSGMKISKLCLGGFSVVGKGGPEVMDVALRQGVDCWEITGFTGKVYGEYFKKHPAVRPKVFLTAKVKSTDPAVMQQQLDKVLLDNETSVVDFLAIHVLDDVSVLTQDVRKWVEKVKKEKKIRLFGFCTHKNMDNCLSGAAELGWIDGIQTFYNYRMQNVRSMEDALQKCHEKGIGIFTVKSMGLCVRKESELNKLAPNKGKLDSLLAARSLSFEQAKLKAIWSNPNVTSICSLMPNAAILRSNASAAMDERPLDAGIMKALGDYAAGTGRYFCRRCGVCETVNADKIPIFSIMEMLMYLNGYGWREFALEGFEQIPPEIRGKISGSDYSASEKVCPQKMPIAELMKEADKELSR